MRHRKAGNNLGRSSAHRRATLANMLVGLIDHGRLKTTQTKARELRRVAEKTVTRATRLGDILLKEPSTLDASDRARLVHAIRLVRQTVRSREATLRLFSEWAPRYLGRPGGYTTMYKLGPRNGDKAPMVLLKFVEADKPALETAKAAGRAKRSKAASSDKGAKPQPSKKKA